MKAIKLCFGGLLMLGLASCGDASLFQCDTAIHDEAVSPSGKLKVGIADVQCGATTEDSSWVVLTEAGKKFDYKKDRIATFEGKLKSVTWKHDELIVTYADAKPFLMTPQVKGIHVIYRQQ